MPTLDLVLLGEIHKEHHKDTTQCCHHGICLQSVVTRQCFDACARTKDEENVEEIATDNIDEVIQIIRASASIPDAKANLMERFGLDEVLPWDMIDCGVTKEYLLRERKKAYEEKTTPSCAEHCNGCGANKLGGKNRWCK